MERITGERKIARLRFTLIYSQAEELLNKNEVSEVRIEYIKLKIAYEQLCNVHNKFLYTLVDIEASDEEIEKELEASDAYEIKYNRIVEKINNLKSAKQKEIVPYLEENEKQERIILLQNSYSKTEDGKIPIEKDGKEVEEEKYDIESVAACEDTREESLTDKEQNINEHDKTIYDQKGTVSEDRTDLEHKSTNDQTIPVKAGYLLESKPDGKGRPQKEERTLGINENNQTHFKMAATAKRPIDPGGECKQ